MIGTLTGPRAALVAALVWLCLLPRPVLAASPTWDHASFIQRDGATVLAYDGKPFFVFGASFFYERTPESQWRESLARMRAMGINTIDLYVPWNWHELADGDFDFEGRTSPRRNLRALVALIRDYDFKVIVRPGPVIRNEWRNGGYPAWLLEKPEYNMPEHDRLEGRYPPIATLQNANSDEAASAWMRNQTHLTYATRWLQRALREFAPIADRVIGVALDDDQGAYIDNQTWPAPNLQKYLGLLEGVVHGVTGPKLHCFINSYQMKVTASSPVWTMANWYQSDTFSTGEHDRSQLEFTTALLQTRSAQPALLSEFQAGWLDQPNDVAPRGADPTNTALAYGTAVASGVRGIVNFPVQDSLNPAGWEAPFANAFYGWDAALRAGYTSSAIFDGVPVDTTVDGAAATTPDPSSAAAFENARYGPTAGFGEFITAFGSSLAGAVPVDDLAIGYLTSAYDPASLDNGEIAQIAERTRGAERACDLAGAACRLVDLRYIDDASLARMHVLVLPIAGDARLDRTKFTSAVQMRLRRFGAAGGLIVVTGATPSANAIGSALGRANRTPVLDGIPGARFARSTDGAELGFLTISNYTNSVQEFPGAVLTLDGREHDLPILKIGARETLITPVDLRLRNIAPAFAPGDRLIAQDCPATFRNDPAGPGLLANVGVHSAACSFNFEIGDNSVQKFEVPNAGPADTLVSISTQGVVRDVPAPAPSALPRVPVSNFVPFRPGEIFVTKTPPLHVAPAAKSNERGGPTGVPYGKTYAYRSDIYEEGRDALILQNALVRVIVAPDAGGRAFAFEDGSVHRNLFTTVGALRDDVAVEPPLSTADKIAKYTHQFPAGTFNRPYDVQIESGTRTRARLDYTMPDAVPKPIHFSRTLELDPDVRFFSCDESADVAPGGTQRAVSVTSLVVGDGSNIAATTLLTPDATPFAASTSREVTGNALGYFDPATKDLALVAWRTGDVEKAQILEQNASIIVRLTLAPGKIAHTIYGYESAATVDAARARVTLAAERANGAPLAFGMK